MTRGRLALATLVALALLTSRGLRWAHDAPASADGSGMGARPSGGSPRVVETSVDDERRAWQGSVVQGHEAQVEACGWFGAPIRCRGDVCVSLAVTDPELGEWERKSRFLRRPRLAVEEMLERELGVISPCWEAQRAFWQGERPWAGIAALEGPDRMCIGYVRRPYETGDPIPHEVRALCAELGGSASWPRLGPG